MSALLQLREARLSFGGKPLFDGVDLALAAGDRASLVGRNGAGKSTLLKVLAGLAALDGGTRFVQPGSRLAMLAQVPDFEGAPTVADYVAGGLPETERGPGGDARVAAELDRVALAGDKATATLSGGEARRADLARALVASPDILLLDEPTNHLDLPTIAWLEAELKRFAGALMVISHDRAFLAAVSTVTLWLEGGVLRRLDRGFAAFDEWAEAIIADQAARFHKDQRKLAEETRWLREGLSARRRRNMGRVRALQDLRRDLAERGGRGGLRGLEASEAARGGGLVVEAERIEKRFGDRVILAPFSLRLARGARLAIIGPNGAGKTTLVRLLLGLELPDTGSVRLGSGLEVALFDQNRASLDPEATLWEVMCPAGGDQLRVGTSYRHVVGYLKEFLFSEAQARGPVKALSGGERARLLLAQLFARPSNLLVLDEPTNDLDFETLDLLQEAIDGYSGTVILVSHDRDFIDRVATETIVLEGEGTATRYGGGYTDALAQRGGRPIGAVSAAAPSAKPVAKSRSPSSPPKDRLGYKEQRERAALADRLPALEAEIQALEGRLADSGFYARDRAEFEASSARLAQAREDLAAAEERWLELELRAEALGQ